MREPVLVKKLPLKIVLADALNFCLRFRQQVLLFSGLNYLFCAAAAYSWKSFWFWPVLVLMYMLWGGLIRWYFKRKPYLQPEALFYSMIPSTKIVVLSVLIVSAVLLLPVAVFFIPGLPAEFISGYSHFLQVTMQESDIMDTIVNLIMVLLSPVIFYRPVLAWISALIGRSGSFHQAWNRTKGNYWEFLLLAIAFDLLCALIYKGGLSIGISIYLLFLPLSFLLIYSNLVLCRIYEVFFLDIEVE